MGISACGNFSDSHFFILQVCLVGASRNYLQSDEDEAEQRRANYIQSRRPGSVGATGQGSGMTNNADISEENKDSVGTSQSDWGAGFRPRDKVETVRNCAALPRDFVDAIVLQVAKVLLEMSADDNKGDWNRGGKPRTHSAHQH